MSRIQLSSLCPGDMALIAGLSAETGLKNRLQALGFRSGKQVQMLRKGWFGGPLHVRVGMTEVMIRRRDAIAINLISATGDKSHDQL